MGIEVRLLTDQEEDKLYGSRILEPGTCYSRQDHFYMQRENDVLHVKDDIINILHPGHLNREDYNEITQFEFKLKIKKTIFDMDLDEFWNKI